MTWQPERRISSTYDGLDRPGLHPRDLVLFADHQYDVVPYQRWRPETELEWVPAHSLVTGEEVWIPLLATHLGYLPSTEAALFPATSTGFAAWPDLAGATLRALLEVIERDAFAIAWSHRLPGRCVAAGDVPDEQTSAIAALYARRGVEVVVHLLPSDTVATVALAIMWSDRPPAAAIGVSAALDPVAAARSAVFEAGQVRPILGSSLRDPAVRARAAELAATPSKVTTLDDHDLLYADPRAAATGMRFLRDAPRQPWPDAAPVLAQGNDDLTDLTRSLAEVAPDVLAVDVTPPDVAGLGVSVVRGLVPGFVPIWFGADQARLGGRRLLEMPSRIGSAPAARAVWTSCQPRSAPPGMRPEDDDEPSTFRTDQPLAWMYHRGSTRSAFDTPDAPVRGPGPGGRTRGHRGSRCHPAYLSARHWPTWSASGCPAAHSATSRSASPNWPPCCGPGTASPE